MNASDYLTTSQISRFAVKELSVDESHAVGGGICSGVPTDMEIAEMASLNEGRRTPLVLSPGVVKKLGATLTND